MVLLSFLLVLAAAVTLVIGLVGSGLGLIYVSIACSLGAGIVLAVAVLRSRPQAELATAGPAPLADTREPARTAPAAQAGASEPRSAVTVLERDEAAGRDLDLGAEEEEVVEEEEEEEAPITAAAASIAGERDDAEEWAVGASLDDEEFPIADYDELRVNEIVPLLPELDPDELDVVRAREAGDKNRATIISRIDQLQGVEEAAPPPKQAPAKKAPAKKAASRSTTKKTAAKKTASTAKKATATKTPAKKATAKKTTAKKTTATKTTAKKAAKKTTKKS